MTVLWFIYACLICLSSLIFFLCIHVQFFNENDFVAVLLEPELVNFKS